MRRTYGFTFIELIVVVAALGVLLGIGAVFIDVTRFSTSQAATGLANNIRRVRFEAIRANASTYLQFDNTNSGAYSIFVDADGDGVADAGEVVLTVTFGQGGVEGVELSSSVAQIGFDRRGIPLSTGGTAVLSSSRSNYSRTVVFSATGNVEVN